MRWFVEISSPGQNAQPSRKVCVEAAQWQPALQKARALRGDHGPLNNFSVDLLETAYRAIDPTTRVRYVVQRAPDDAALTDEPGAPPAAAAASPRAADPDAREKAETLATASGRTLGRVTAIVEGAQGSVPVPYAAAQDAARSSVEIAPGTQSIDASVSVTFALT